MLKPNMKNRSILGRLYLRPPQEQFVIFKRVLLGAIPIIVELKKALYFYLEVHNKDPFSVNLLF